MPEKLKHGSFVIQEPEKKDHRSELSGCKRLFYFLYVNLSFYIVKFFILSAKWVHVTATISPGYVKIKFDSYPDVVGLSGEEYKHIKS